MKGTSHQSHKTATHHRCIWSELCSNGPLRVSMGLCWWNSSALEVQHALHVKQAASAEDSLYTKAESQSLGHVQWWSYPHVSWWHCYPSPSHIQVLVQNLRTKRQHSTPICCPLLCPYCHLLCPYCNQPQHPICCGATQSHRQCHCARPQPGQVDGRPL